MMAQGDFTKEEAESATKAFSKIFEALSKVKQVRFFGHANDVFLFLNVAKAVAPAEKKEKKSRGTSH